MVGRGRDGREKEEIDGREKTGKDMTERRKGKVRRERGEE